ncbi:hypothetical protein HZC35_03445 [Candidatus Saganbacteria bacterium]|nr:hypothetical protein [Candidatus Saganbacteria bacterium]
MAEFAPVSYYSSNNNYYYSHAGNEPTEICSDETIQANQERVIAEHREQLVEKGIVAPDGEVIDEQRLVGLTYLSDEEIANRLGVPNEPLYYIPGEAYDRSIGDDYSWSETAHTRIGYMPMTDDGPIQGLPLGGFGSAGGIERTYNGNFPVVDIVPGRHVYNDNDTAACQFHVYQGIPEEGVSYAQTLWAGHPEGDRLASWNFDYPDNAGTYHALYPRAWYEYDHPEMPARFAVEQFSPIIAGNYRETSLPVSVFEWVAENPTDKEVVFSVMLTWQNMTGWIPQEVVEQTEMPGIRVVGGEQAKVYQTGWNMESAGNFNYHRMEGDMEAVILTGNRPDNISTNGEFCLATQRQPGVEISYFTNFNTDGDGSQAWTPFSLTGRLPNTDDHTVAQEGQNIGAAIAVTVRLAPGERKEFPIVLSWDFPQTEYGEDIVYDRYYTRYFGNDGGHSFDIAREALQNHEEWDRQIAAWQEPVLNNQNIPSWARGAMLNELYYLSAASLVWDAESGLFAVPESERDYVHSETTDVASYSPATAILWPEIEQRMVEHLAETVFIQDPNERLYNIYQWTSPIPEEVRDVYFAERKSLYAVPHDIGAFNEDPLYSLNTYNWQNPNIWPGLQTGLALRIYRDYVLSGELNSGLISDSYPAVLANFSYLEQMDRDGDFIPDHRGNVSDWTYDNWKVAGMTLYEGLRFLAAVSATREMAEMQGDLQTADRLQYVYDTAQASFNQRLWNGEYYDIHDGNPDVFGDYLGLLYTEISNLPAPIPEDQALSALRTVYEDNVLGFGNGYMGMVTGTRDGEVIEGEQEREMWIGTSYAAAATMISLGLKEEGWRTAYGTYNATYNYGLAFRTPEAITLDSGDGSSDSMVGFRCGTYYRPLSIWNLWLVNQ